MKKLFTLVALLACFLGAKAEWVEDYAIDYSTKTNFPFYVMGYVPEWVDGVMTDYGADYRYATQDVLDNGDSNGNGKLTDAESVVGTVMAGNTEYQKVTGAGPYWHQYFIADGIPTEMDGSYTVKALVRASEAVTIDVNMGWGWGEGQQAAGSVSIPASSEFVEVEWSYSGIAGTSCNLVAQPGASKATIEWKSLTVSHNAKAQRPTVWQEWLTNDGQPVIVEKTVQDIPNWMGNAETPWPDANVAYNDAEKNYLVCAWSKERMRNLGEPDANGNVGWNPFPADIEVDETNPNNHVFVCHGQPAITEGDASAWDNQFWIQSPKSWKEGEQLKISFRYRASKDGVKTNTQCHKQTPSDYQHWAAIGDITFNTAWQTFDQVISWPSGAGDGISWSIAFNLNAVDKDAINFYFDDLSWESMKLDEGLFVAATNTKTGLEYDFDNAIEFVYDEGLQAYVATVGTKGDQSTWVDEIMISTVRGNDAAFKSNTIKPSGDFVGEDAWGNYTEASIAKIKPGNGAAGAWTISVDTENKQMNIIQIDGELPPEPIEINPNPTVVVVHGLEREPTSGEQPADEEAGIAAGTGQPWDNQFFLVANRELETGEETVVAFSYRASKEAKTTTQLHGEPGAYLHWAAIGDVNFTTEWQDFSTDLIIPSEANGMKSIAFNMAEIKEACDYEIKDIIWKVKGDYESLIDQTGTKNFYVKEGAGTAPHEFGTDPAGINSVTTDVKNSSATTYNLAGQRVSKDYKGIVVKSGKKYVVK